MCIYCLKSRGQYLKSCRISDDISYMLFNSQNWQILIILYNITLSKGLINNELGNSLVNVNLWVIIKKKFER